MSLWKIAWQRITQRGLASTLTGLSLALGVALVVVVLVGSIVAHESGLRVGDRFRPAHGKVIQGEDLQIPAASSIAAGGPESGGDEFTTVEEFREVPRLLLVVGTLLATLVLLAVLWLILARPNRSQGAS